MTLASYDKEKSLNIVFETFTQSHFVFAYSYSIVSPLTGCKLLKTLPLYL